MIKLTSFILISFFFCGMINVCSAKSGRKWHSCDKKGDPLSELVFNECKNKQFCIIQLGQIIHAQYSIVYTPELNFSMISIGYIRSHPDDPTSYTEHTIKENVYIGNLFPKNMVVNESYTYNFTLIENFFYGQNIPSKLKFTVTLYGWNLDIYRCAQNEIYITENDE